MAAHEDLIRSAAPTSTEGKAGSLAGLARHPRQGRMKGCCVIESNRRLIQVAAAAIAVAQAKNCSQWEALVFLAGQVGVGQLAPTLYMPESTAKDRLHRASPDESRMRWRDMAQRATANRIERDPMPAAASTWYVHVDDFSSFVEAVGLGDAPTIRGVVGRHAAPTQIRQVLPAEPTAVATPQTKASSPAETAKARRARLLDWREEEESSGGKSGALERVTARERLRRPNADRSNIGKDIRKGRKERAAEVTAKHWLGPAA